MIHCVHIGCFSINGTDVTLVQAPIDLYVLKIFSDMRLIVKISLLSQVRRGTATLFNFIFSRRTREIQLYPLAN